MRAIRQHGQKEPGTNVHELFGLNFRPSELHALLGLCLMKKASSLVEARRLAASNYDRLLMKSPLAPILPPGGTRPSYYKYITLLPLGVERGEFKARLWKKHNQRLAGEVYTTPVHAQPFWKTNPEFLAAGSLDNKNSMFIAKRHICLPIWPDIPESDQEEVVEALLDTLKTF
jgi:dTDP-4-amino-4,6-dideoxygalactose transaminase